MVKNWLEKCNIEQLKKMINNRNVYVWGAFDDIALYRIGDYITESDSDADKDDA